jgi:hypothetical protein
MDATKTRSTQNAGNTIFSAVMIDSAGPYAILTFCSRERRDGSFEPGRLERRNMYMRRG